MNPSRRQKCLLWGMAVGSGLLLMGCVVILYVQCKPSRALWVLVPGARCWGPGVLVNYSIIVGGMDTFSTLRLGCMLTVHSNRGRRRCLSGDLSSADHLESAHESEEEDRAESGLGARRMVQYPHAILHYTYTDETVPVSWPWSNAPVFPRYTMFMIQPVCYTLPFTYQN